jgi:hypothetical protein
MKEIWTGKVGQVATRYGEHAPATAVCCNACRTCVTANAVGLAVAAAGSLALAARGLAKRVSPRAFSRS